MNKLRRRCEHCNEVKNVGEDIFWDICPFNSEIRGDDSNMWHCKSCDYDCAMEI